ncbi:MAG: CHAT domain-containing protein [Gemmatimonadales bacterium]
MKPVLRRAVVFALGPIAIVAGAAAQEPSSSGPGALVREHPDSARQAIETLLARSADQHAPAPLAAADRLAGEFARVWNDSVPSRTVTWFREAGPETRVAKVSVDSLRRAGGSALRGEGLAPALRLWRTSLSEAGRIADSAGLVAATVNIGVGYYTDRRSDSAYAYLRAGYRLALLIRDYRAAGTAVGTMASLAKDRGDAREASDLYREAVSLHQRVGDSRGLAAAYNNLGLVAGALGDTARARVSYLRALELNRRFGRAPAAATNLVNLGALADLQGAYRRAADLYHEALAAYTSEGDERNVGVVLQNLGRLELRRGNYQAAVTNLHRALATVERVGPVDAAVEVRIDLARALAATGEIQAATATLDQADGAERARTADRTLALLALARAEMAARLNRPRDADRHLVRAERYFRVSGDPAGQADAHEQRALLDLRQNNHESALRQLQADLRARELAGDLRATAGTRLLLGYVHETRGDTAGARLEYTRARGTFARTGDAGGEAVALGALGQLAQREGLPLTADSFFTSALRRLDRQPAPPIAWWLHLGRGEALQARHQSVDAAAEFQAAVAAVERSSGAFTLAANRAAFMADKWQPYASLARLQQSRGEPDSAFAVSERMRAQELLELLTRGARSNSRDAAEAPEARDLRQRITELSIRLSQPTGEPTAYRGLPLHAGDQDAAREALADAEEKYARVMEGLRQGGGGSGALAARATVSAREVQRRLRVDEAMLEYLVGDSTSMVFVVTSDSVTALDLQVGARTLSRLIDFARGTIAAEAGADDQALWRVPLQRLYAYLIRPVEEGGLLAGRQRLLIVPHGTLHYLPFAALLAPGDTPHFLTERFVISYAPSAAVWAQLAAAAPAPPAARRLLVLAPMNSRTLPGALTEAREIARVYGAEATSLLGPRASEDAFRELAPKSEIVHVASFGVLNKQNPLFSYVALQPGAGQDGRLEVHEIFGLSLQASLVVLSACQTALGAGALGDVPAGDDWVGLVQAFLSAGSARVMATLWPVADRPTASLMASFYARLKSGVPDDVALAEAQRDALRRPDTRHPRHWAAFVLTGGPAGRRP